MVWGGCWLPADTQLQGIFLLKVSEIAFSVGSIRWWQGNERLVGTNSDL
jgi:hypothetical protein